MRREMSQLSYATRLPGEEATQRDHEACTEDRDENRVQQAASAGEPEGRHVRVAADDRAG